MEIDVDFYQPVQSILLKLSKTHGLIKGLKLGIKRIFKCHPFKILGGNHGIDFVPEIQIIRIVKMDNKNVFVAIALSMSVLLFWGAFFETPKKPIDPKNNQKVEQKSEAGSIAPTINQPTIIKNISREDSIKKDKRVKIENNSIVGSINLKGAQIDDISFKNHKQKVEGDKNIIFLNPAETENGFYIETGWTSVGNKIKIPTKESVWSVKGNNILSEFSPIVLQWNNGEGIIFEKNRTRQ